MASNFRFQKRFIIASVALLIAADLTLAVYSWHSGSASGNRVQNLAAQTEQLKILRADIKRAKDIQSSMPAIQADCDKFEHLLFPASTGYSSVTLELDSIAQRAGAQMQDLSFKQTEVLARGLASVEITSAITGNYSSLVRFVNGLQRSSNVYVLDSLSLAGESQNLGSSSQLKVVLRLQTYFRNAA